MSDNQFEASIQDLTQGVLLPGVGPVPDHIVGTAVRLHREKGVTRFQVSLVEEVLRKRWHIMPVYPKSEREHL